MNINGQGHLLILIQVYWDSTVSKFFSLETAGPIKAKFHVKPPYGMGERKFVKMV